MESQKLTTKEEIESTINDNYEYQSFLKILNVLNTIDFKNCNIDELSNETINHIVYMVLRAIGDCGSVHWSNHTENGSIFSYSSFRFFITKLQKSVSPVFCFDIPPKMNYTGYIFSVTFKDITRYYEVLDQGNGLREIKTEEEYLSMRPPEDSNETTVELIPLKEMEF